MSQYVQIIELRVRPEGATHLLEALARPRVADLAPPVVAMVLGSTDVLVIQALPSIQHLIHASFAGPHESPVRSTAFCSPGVGDPDGIGRTVGAPEGCPPDEAPGLVVYLGLSPVVSLFARSRAGSLRGYLAQRLNEWLDSNLPGGQFRVLAGLERPDLAVLGYRLSIDHAALLTTKLLRLPAEALLDGGEIDIPYGLDFASPGHNGKSASALGPLFQNSQIRYTSAIHDRHGGKGGRLDGGSVHVSRPWEVSTVRGRNCGVIGFRAGLDPGVDEGPSPDRDRMGSRLSLLEEQLRAWSQSLLHVSADRSGNLGPEASPGSRWLARWRRGCESRGLSHSMLTSGHAVIATAVHSVANEPRHYTEFLPLVSALVEASERTDVPWIDSAESAGLNQRRDELVVLVRTIDQLLQVRLQESVSDNAFGSPRLSVFPSRYALARDAFQAYVTSLRSLLGESAPVMVVGDSFDAPSVRVLGQSAILVHVPAWQLLTPALWSVGHELAHCVMERRSVPVGGHLLAHPLRPVARNAQREIGLTWRALYDQLKVELEALLPLESEAPAFRGVARTLEEVHCDLISARLHGALLRPAAEQKGWWASWGLQIAECVRHSGGGRRVGLTEARVLMLRCLLVGEVLDGGGPHRWMGELGQTCRDLLRLAEAGATQPRPLLSDPWSRTEVYGADTMRRCLTLKEDLGLSDGQWRLNLALICRDFDAWRDAAPTSPRRRAGLLLTNVWMLILEGLEDIPVARAESSVARVGRTVWEILCDAPESVRAWPRREQVCGLQSVSLDPGPTEVHDNAEQMERHQERVQALLMGLSEEHRVRMGRLLCGFVSDSSRTGEFGSETDSFGMWEEG